MKTVLVFIVDDNPRYVRFVNNAVRYARHNANRWTIAVLTLRHTTRLAVGADLVVPIDGYVERRPELQGHIGRFPAFLAVKFLLPSIPELSVFDRAVVADCDTCIIDRAVLDLESVDLNGNYFAAVEDDGFRDGGRKEVGGRPVRNPAYFNAGFFVMDLAAAKASAGYAALADGLVRTMADLRPRYPEQDSWNLTFGITPLDRRYNTFVGRSFRPEDIANSEAYVVHFTSCRKKRILDRVCVLPQAVEKVSK